MAAALPNESTPSEAATEARAAAPPHAPPQRTMLGMPAVPHQGAELPPPAQEPTAERRPPPQRTMLGMPAVPHQGAEPPPPAQEPTVERRPSPRSNRTVLGMSAPSAPAPKETPGAQLPARSQRTVFGMPRAVSPRSTPGPMPEATPHPTSFEQTASTSRSGMPGWLLAATATGVLLLGAAATAWWWFERPPRLEVSLLTSEAGRKLRIEAPELPSGTRITLGTAHATLRNGEATLDIPEASLSLGENHLRLRIETPSGERSERDVILTLRFHVESRLETLGQWPPRLLVEVAAPPKAKAWLDDRPVPLDERGRGQVALPVDPRPPTPAGERYEHAVRYRITLPDGKERAGVLRTRLPVASLLLDRPGEELVIDRSKLTVSGSVAPGASVRLNGTKLDVDERGRFEGEWILSEPSTDVQEPRRVRGELVVLQPGRWPRKEVLQVLRVSSLAAYAQRLARSAEPLRYEALAAAPRVHRGRRVSFRGYVYHLQPDVSARRQVAQMLAQPCSRKARCALWVTFPAGTEVEVGARLFVVGETAGMQRFRTRKGEQMEVPRVDASVLVPQSALPDRRRKRRRGR